MSFVAAAYVFTFGLIGVYVSSVIWRARAVRRDEIGRAAAEQAGLGSTRAAEPAAPDGTARPDEHPQRPEGR